MSALTAFYNETKGHAVWVSQDGFNPKAVKTIHEIKSAADWGLDPAAFQLPANPSAQAKPETLPRLNLN